MQQTIRRYVADKKKADYQEGLEKSYADSAARSHESYMKNPEKSRARSRESYMKDLEKSHADVQYEQGRLSRMGQVDHGPPNHLWQLIIKFLKV